MYHASAAEEALELDEKVKKVKETLKPPKEDETEIESMYYSLERGGKKSNCWRCRKGRFNE